MPYPDDLEGKYLDFSLDQAALGVPMPLPANADPNGLLAGQTNNMNVAVYRDDSPGSGVLTLVHDGTWSFTFLRYVPGVATIAPLRGSILSGPFSGCRFCRYTQNGRMNVAHIGTGSTSQSPDTVEVKRVWREFINTLPPLSVMGFNPLSYFTMEEMSAEQLGGGAPYIMGYFGSAYAMLFAPLPASTQMLVDGRNEQKRMVKVARIVTLPTLKPWSQLDWPEASAGGRRGWATIKAAFRRFS